MQLMQKITEMEKFKAIWFLKGSDKVMNGDLLRYLDNGSYVNID